MAFNKYLDPVLFSEKLKSLPEYFWMKRGEKMALGLFKQMSSRVPAYKDFLKKKGITAEKVKTMADFKRVPTLDKDNYLKKYPLESLCFDGNFKNKSWSISTTSGSTGTPFYFPRTVRQDWQYALLAEMYLRDNFQIQNKSTLYINAFPMGPWIGGVFTYEAIRLLARRGGYPLSIITVGINSEEILKAVKKFGKKFDQIIIGCYPPFLKDAIDEGINKNLKWRDYNLGFIFSAEGFTEKFRDYIIEKTGLKNRYTTTLNHYGTVDLGTMAHETPLCILLRRLSQNYKQVADNLFADFYRQPTLCQYLPELFYFETCNNRLICSAYSGIPLVRYDLKDRGGIFSLQKLNCSLIIEEFDLLEKAKEAGILETIWQVPFVYVFERDDFSVSLYAFQVYPQSIQKAIQERSFNDELSGKFSMSVDYDDQMNQYLELNLELKKTCRLNAEESEKFKKRVKQAVIRRLLKENSEYAKTYSQIPEKVEPKIVLWCFGHEKFFKPGIKQKWTKHK